MAVKFSNNAATTLAANVSTSDTSISVSDGSVFPSISGGHYTYVTLEDINANREIVKVTAISSNTLTVVRGQDGTSARAFSSADKCELRITAALLNDVASQADTDTNTTYSAGSGITLAGTTFSLTDKSDYDTAFGWGNHASAGYLTSHQSLSGYATETYVGTQVSNLVDSSPSTLNTLNELAAALGDDPNFATTVSTSIGTKLPLAGGTLTGNLSLGDNVKAQFGAGSDLQIYHNGNNSFITDTGTGSLYVRASDSFRVQTATNEEMIKADADGAVTLYNNNAAKLATTSTGIDVTGAITTSGNLTVGGADVTITANIIHSGDADTYFGFNTDDSYRVVTGGTQRLLVNSTGIDVTGTVTADGLTSSGKITITGGSDGADLHINNTSPTLGFTDSNSFSDSNDIYIVRGTSSGKLQFQFFDHSANTTTQTFLIDQTGNTTVSGNISTTGSSITVDPAAGDAILSLQGTAGAQTLRLDQNSIRTSTNSPLTLLTNNTNALKLNTDQSVNIPNGGLMIGATTAPTTANSKWSNTCTKRLWQHRNVYRIWDIFK